ncbi:NADH-quinone oxidoreductase subunit A [Candidatus Palibaumannia cicadellinicola]|uniref:NADH-quinone oxidoreductase subunit A n=1 Tax=Candidatus Palibaumannia cicadellinicola TaxID=186490 RepID=A0A2N4XWC8_9GAMM|nr:NADH-quinone oxidoreductase subunit A [Candidatus Baumannia cicadellinicola]PLK58281.1 NADH-quinone oxidoreductase subunit A [Candidatus Baumannia cicadellinicola]
MSMTTEVIANNWAFAIFVIGAIALCTFLLIISFVLGGRQHITVHSRNLPFESGINSVGTARLRLAAKFYLVAMFFVIFDVETFYLYAWASALREVGWLGFCEAIMFILILLISLVYLVRIGGLNWTPDSFLRLKRPDPKIIMRN